MWKYTEIRMTIDDFWTNQNHVHLREQTTSYYTDFLSSITNEELYIHFYYIGVQEVEDRSIFTIYSSQCSRRKRSYRSCSLKFALNAPKMVVVLKVGLAQSCVLHSALSVGKKYDDGVRFLRKKWKVVVGARSAVFCAFENLGIILLIEEAWIKVTQTRDNSEGINARECSCSGEDNSVNLSYRSW